MVDADGGVCGGFGDRADGGDGLFWSMLVYGAAGVHHVVTDETGRSPHVVLVRGRRRVEQCDAVCLGQNLGGLRGLGRGFLGGHALSALQAAGMAALVVLMASLRRFFPCDGFCFGHDAGKPHGVADVLSCSCTFVPSLFLLF